MRGPHPTLTGLAIAVALPGLITALAPLTELEGKQGVGILFVVGVTVAAYAGGLAAGVLCSALSLVSYVYFFLPPTGTFTGLDGGETLLAAGLFLVAALVISLMVAGLRRATASAEEAARRTALSEARYRAVVEATAQIIWRADADGRDGGLSPQWLDFTGQATEEAHGLGWLDCVHPDDRERVAAQWREAVAGGVAFETEYRLRNRDGDYRVVDVRGVPVWDADGALREWIGVSFDVTAARQAEEMLATRARQQRELADLGRLALSGVRLETLFRETTDVIAATLGADVSVVIQDVGDADLVIRAATGWEPDQLEPQRSPAGSLARLVLNSENVVVSAQTHADPRFTMSPILRSAGAASAAAARIFGRERAWGLMAAMSSTPRRFSPDDTDFLASVANVLAAAIERAAGLEEIRTSETRLRLALDAAELGAWDWDVATGEVAWGTAVERAFGLSPGGFDGQFETFAGLIHPDDRERVLLDVEAALAGQREYRAEFRVRRPNGEVGWVTTEGALLREENGEPARMVGLVRDVTARKRHEAALAFRADAGAALTASLDFEHTLAEVARLAVPGLADGCVVDVLEEPRGVHQLAVVHVDPEREDAYRAIELRWPSDAESPASMLSHVLRDGRPRLVPVYDGETLAQSARDPEHLDALRRLAPVSALAVPLVARGRPLGMITLFTDVSGRRLGAEEADLMAELGRMAALAIDNARLYQHRTSVASILQRSLLPPALPTVAGLELAARYRPAGEGLEVGGDFYDAFPASDSSLAIAIGDVCGKGPEAAALTGLTRHTIRAAALHDSSPASTLATVNEIAFQEQGGSTFCTVAYGQVRLDGVGATATLSSGGHPLPLLLRAGGDVTAVGTFGSLLGAFEEVELEDTTVRLEAGDALVLYTDGLPEGLERHLSAGEERLAQFLRGCAGLGADAIAEGLERLVTETGRAAGRDDMAILVVRVAPTAGSDA